MDKDAVQKALDTLKDRIEAQSDSAMKLWAAAQTAIEWEYDNILLRRALLELTGAAGALLRGLSTEQYEGQMVWLPILKDEWLWAENALAQAEGVLRRGG